MTESAARGRSLSQGRIEPSSAITRAIQDDSLYRTYSLAGGGAFGGSKVFGRNKTSDNGKAVGFAGDGMATLVVTEEGCLDDYQTFCFQNN